MCGIAGEVSFERHPSSADWSLISSLMARRGPDDEGFWADQSTCTLVFRRLAIQDLSRAANQPMASDDGRYRLVFNGEIYNFPALRSELTRSGIRFRTHGDAEVVLQALATWGKAALERFDGMFALAFWDAAERRVLLARDPFGIKPLYYVNSGQGIAFGSQYDQILRHPWSSERSPHPAALALYFRLGYVPAPFAFLERTHMLEPGTWLQVRSDGSMRSGRYFDATEALLSADHQALLSPSPRVEAAISESVGSQLISDVPVGGFLSGGIDSPLVCAYARQRMKTSFPAFTLAVPGDPMDEASDAKSYAQELALRHTVREVNETELLQAVEAATSACSEPFADFSIIPTLLICERAREEVKVLLSGDGGDELFWGYVGRMGKIISSSSDFKRSHAYRSARWAAKRFLSLGHGYSNLRYRTLGDWYRDSHQHFPEPWLHKIFPDIPPWPQEYRAYSFNATDPDTAARLVRVCEVVDHLPRVLLKVDRASMHSSIEVRVPLLGKAVVDAASQVRWSDCLDLDTGRGKIPLRSALRQLSSFQTRSKRGFSVPMGEWLRGPLKETFEQLVLGRKELMGMWMKPRAVEDFYRLHCERKINQGWSLWILLSGALWDQRHYIPAKSG